MDNRQLMHGLMYAEHMGDVNRYLPDLAVALGLPELVWDDDIGDYGSWVFEDEKCNE